MSEHSEPVQDEAIEKEPTPAWLKVGHMTLLIITMLILFQNIFFTKWAQDSMVGFGIGVIGSVGSMAAWITLIKMLKSDTFGKTLKEQWAENGKSVIFGNALGLLPACYYSIAQFM